MATTEWLNSNSSRAYPLADDSTQVADEGLSLPTDLLLDISVMYPDYGGVVRVGQVWASKALIGVSLLLDGVPIASAMVVRSGYKPNTAIPLVPYAGVFNVSGWVVFGAWAPASGRATFTFSTDAQSRLARNAVRCAAKPPVSGFYKAGGSILDKLTGLVVVESDGYLKVARHESDEQRIVISIADPAARGVFLGDCNKTDCGVAPVRSINGVCPDANGVITVVFEAAS